MLLYHPIRKTFDDFEEIYEYYFDDDSGTLIETDKELKPGQILFLRGISDYAIKVEAVWQKNGKRFFLTILRRKL